MIGKWLRKRADDPRGERAQVMVETAIALPVQLVITLAIMQYCLIGGAKQMVNVAAHAACRAVLVGEDPHRAASILCSPIAGSYVDGVVSQSSILHVKVGDAMALVQAAKGAPARGP